jgi:D-amino peptidase
LSFGNKEFYEPVRELLTKDVNAVIDGLFAGGADEVDVVDAHGSGNPEPDILLDKMDKRAKLVDKDESFRPYVDMVKDGNYDGIAVVCMHSKTGGGGFAAHTYSIGMDWIINDKSINETEIIAYAWGDADVPVIFASGDDKLKEQLAYMDWLQYVTVKYAKGAADAELRPLEEVYKELKTGAELAVKNLRKAKAIKPTLPIKAGLHAIHPANLRQMDGVPGINYKDNTVTFEASSYQEAYRGITKLIRIAGNGRWALLWEVIRNQENKEDIYKAYEELFEQRWADVESGKWSPPEKKKTEKPTTKKKYFGVR